MVYLCTRAHTYACIQMNRAIINTLLALTSSCIVTFMMDNLLRPKNKFSMVSIQARNACTHARVHTLVSI